MNDVKANNLIVKALSTDDAEIEAKKPFVYPSGIITFGQYQLVPKWLVESLIESIGNATFVALTDRVLTGLSYSILGDDITISSGTWSIEQSNYEKVTSTVFSNIPLSAAGLQRYITIYADENNAILKAESTESAIASLPTLPAFSLPLYTVLVSDAEIASPSPNLDGYQLLSEKSGDIEFDKLNTVKYPNTKGVYDFVHSTTLDMGEI